jgi:hypothetical protein
MHRLLREVAVTRFNPWCLRLVLKLPPLLLLLLRAPRPMNLP